MAAVYVPLPHDVKDALLSLASREDRDPRRQAARLIREGLERARVLSDHTNEIAGSPATSEVA
jgi:hypothetical protein